MTFRLFRSLIAGSALVLSAAAALSACGGAAPAPQTPPTPPAEPQQPAPAPEKEEPSAEAEPEAPALPFAASSTEPTEGQAYDSAKRRLLVALLNDESLLVSEPFSDRLTQVVHVAESDPLEKLAAQDGVEVKIGLSQEGLDAALLRLELSLNDVPLSQVSEPLREAVRQVRVTRLRHKLCARRKELIAESSCDAESPAASEKKLHSLLQRVSLKSVYEGGIPTAAGKFLRPLSVDARLKERSDELPLSQLPLLVSWSEQDSPVSAKTDKSGRLIYKLPDEVAVSAMFEVSVDVGALLGAATGKSEGAPGFAQESAPRATVQGRGVSMARAAVVLLGKNPVAAKVAAPIAERALRDVITKPVSLERDAAERLARANPSQWRKLAPSLAEEQAGALDAIVFIEAESEFASRMGTHRVWFEARGKATAINAWTGEVLGEVSAVVTESGFGEERAEQASREALGRDLAEKLRVALDEHSAKLASH